MSADVGAASMVSGVDAAVAVRAGILCANVNSTDDAAVGGFAPMTTTVVALACVRARRGCSAGAGGRAHFGSASKSRS